MFGQRKWGSRRGNIKKMDPGDRMYKSYWGTVGLVMEYTMENYGNPNKRI